MALSYKEQLTHHNWQRKRLEIFQRDNFACRICGKKDIQIHVHHICYLKNKNINDYHNNLLITLCSECHENETYEGMINIYSQNLINNLAYLLDLNLCEMMKLIDEISIKEKEGYTLKESIKLTLLQKIKES
jgi:hypothetical protein